MSVKSDCVACCDSGARVIANSEHSHVGLVVALPNKWTSEEELFVLELTFNLDNVVDAFAEVTYLC